MRSRQEILKLDQEEVMKRRLNSHNSSKELFHRPMLPTSFIPSRSTLILSQFRLSSRHKEVCMHLRSRREEKLLEYCEASKARARRAVRHVRSRFLAQTVTATNGLARGIKFT